MNQLSLRLNDISYGHFSDEFNAKYHINSFRWKIWCDEFVRLNNIGLSHRRISEWSL